MYRNLLFFRLTRTTNFPDYSVIWQNEMHYSLLIFSSGNTFAGDAFVHIALCST